MVRNQCAAPAIDSACSRRQIVSAEMSNAAATCAWVAALVRVIGTAANRRPAVSSASQAKHRFPQIDPAPSRSR